MLARIVGHYIVSDADACTDNPTHGPVTLADLVVSQLPIGN